MRNYQKNEVKSYFFRGLPIYFPLLCTKTKIVGSDLHDPYILLVID